jgi:hypothetical protein
MAVADHSYSYCAWSCCFAHLVIARPCAREIFNSLQGVHVAALAAYNAALLIAVPLALANELLSCASTLRVWLRVCLRLSGFAQVPAMARLGL